MDTKPELAKYQMIKIQVHGWVFIGHSTKTHSRRYSSSLLRMQKH